MLSRLRKCALGVMVGCIVFAFVIGAFILSTNAYPTKNPFSDEKMVFIPNSIIGQASTHEIFSNHEIQIIKTYEPLDLALIKITGATLIELVKISNVEALPNRQFEGCLAQSVEIIKPAASWAALETQFGYSINGTGINVSVLDTGINYLHWDLDDFDENDGTTDPKVIAQWDFVNNDGNAMDDHGHGTHIASIIAGTGNRSSGVYTGVATGANLLIAKVLNNLNQGTESDIMDGIIWAVNNGAHIINLSLASSDSGNGTDALSLAVDWAVRQGVVVIVASGRTSGFYKVAKPGVSNLAITVGASTDADGITTLGGFGPTLDFRLKPELLAPGENIIACRAGITGDLTIGSPINDYYTEVDGTSQAAAHVSGVVALLLQAHPDWLHVDVKAALMGNAEELADDVYKRGAGRVDAVASANTSLLIDPLIDLQLFGGNTIHETTLTIKNIADDNISCQLTAGPSFSISPSLITVPAKSYVTINVNYTPTIWTDYHYESVIRTCYEGVEFRTVLCQVYPDCDTSISTLTIPYNGSLSVAGNLSLDQYVLSDLVNLSVEIWAGDTQLATTPITTTDSSFNFTDLSSPSLYRGTHDLEVRLYQDDEIHYVKRSTLTVEGWTPTLTADEFRGYRDSTVQLNWTLSNINGNFLGNVSVYIMRSFTWELMVGNVTTAFEYLLDLPVGDYQVRFDFHGDSIHKPATAYTMIHVVPPDLGPFARIWPWLIAIGGVIGGAYVINRHISRKKPKISPQERVEIIRRQITDEPKITRKSDPEPSTPPEPTPPSRSVEGISKPTIKSAPKPSNLPVTTQSTHTVEEEPLVLEKEARDYRAGAEPDVLDD